MSGMKLRDSIRAPVRYGEGEGAEVPTLRSALRIGLDEVNNDNVELSDSGRSHPQRRRKSTTKPFNPNLPPAAFPTLDRPHANPHIRRIVLKMPQTSTRRHSGTEFPPPAAPASTPQQTRRVTRDPTSLERIHIDDLENHIASNNASNPVFVSNMAMMASAALKDPMDTSEEEENVAMSDNEDLPDQTQVLLDKIPSPKWSELNSALKVEMVDKAMQTMTWRAICNRLSLGPEDRQKLAEYMNTRNKQVERENKRMEEMRNKQRLALMNIDNSDIKIFAPPPQLVLQRIMRQATREMLLDRTMYTDLMLCTSGDVLAARQYLHQHGLPRSWAGDWGDGMVELRESADDCPGPDQFEWKEDLMVTPPYESARRLMSPAVQTQTDFIQDVGLSNSGAIDPMMLTQSNANPKPTQDCRKYFTHWYPEPVDPTRTVPNFSWAASRHHGIVNLKVGRQRAAQIQQYERTGSKPYGWPAYGPRPSPVAPSAEIETPTRVRHNPIGPQFSLMHNTPGTQQRNIQYTLQPPTAFSRRIPAVNENSPLNRPLDGNRAFRDLNYAESQARFRQQMQQAQLSMLERQGKAQAERYDFQPKPRVSGVSAGGSQYRRTQPYAAVQNIATAQRMVSRAMPQTSQFDAFWYEHQRARAMGDSTGPMDSFIYSDPIIVPEETEDERMAQQPEGEKEEQHSSTGPSSHTDASEDEMMMIPIDSCSPSQ